MPIQVLVNQQDYIGRLQPLLRKIDLDKETLLAYMNSAEKILHAKWLIPDAYRVGAEKIALCFRSDGKWLWSDEVSTYIDRYDLAVPINFLSHVKESKGSPPRLSVYEKQEVFNYLNINHD